MEADDHRTAQSGARGAALVLTVFGTVWWISGTALLSAGAGVPLMASGVACAIALFVLAARRLDARGEREAYRRAAKRFRTVNIVQGISIGAIAALGNVLGLQPWIPGAVAVVVGLHFLPLAGLFARPEYRWAGLLTTGVGLIGCAVASGGGAVTTALPPVGMGCALVLWGSALRLVLAARPFPTGARPRGGLDRPHPTEPP